MFNIIYVLEHNCANMKQFPRKLTRQEKKWLSRGLKSLETGEYFGGGRWVDVETEKVKPLDEPVDTAFFLQQIDGLKVVSKCDCGDKNCYTVMFQHYRPGKKISTIVSYFTEDHRMLNIDVDEETGKLVQLEII